MNKGLTKERGKDSIPSSAWNAMEPNSPGWVKPLREWWERDSKR
jgi:hypothetical protein